MIDCVEFKLARLAVTAAFAIYQPLRGDDIPGTSLPGSRCLASPNAFNDKKIAILVRSHEHSGWLLFAYAKEQNIDSCKKVTSLLWLKIEKIIGKARKEKRRRLSLLCFPAIMQATERRNTGKKLFTIAELCEILGINEKKGHWHRDYKPYWSAMAGILEKWDTEALDDVDFFLRQLEDFIQVEI
jgi:hypothetical protein